MKKNYVTYLLFLLAITLMSCKKNTVSYAYFTGQIANPKEKEIHILKNNQKIKNAILKHNSNFVIKLDSVTEGLFSFKHGNEVQYIFLSPKDSLVMRLNTWDFDESLIFSGKGAVKNNFLMYLFLENEKQEKLFYNYYNLSEKEFKHKTDSLLQIKLTAFKQYKSNSTNISKKFNDLVHLAIYYPIYSQMEKYAMNAINKNLNLSNSFYDFRKDVTIDQTDFNSFYAYRNYVKNYFKTKTIAIVKKNKDKKLSLVMLTQIKKELKQSNFKDELLQNATLNCLLDENCSNNDKQNVLKSFYKNCKNSRKKSEIKSITNSMQFIKKGSKLPSISIQDYQGNSTSIRAKNIHQNTVIYFWPKERNRIVYMAKRLHYLQKKHKNIAFIGIDGQLDNYNWKSFIKSNNLNSENQFQLNVKNKNKWFCNELPRAILIDKNGVIKNDFSYLAQKDFEVLLQKLSKN